MTKTRRKLSFLSNILSNSKTNYPNPEQNCPIPEQNCPIPEQNCPIPPNSEIGGWGLQGQSLYIRDPLI